MPLPVLHVDGDAYDQGRQHGSALRDQIAENLEVYFDRFQLEGRLSPHEVRERAESYRSVLSGHAYWRGIEGVAAGAGLPILDVLALNVRYELLYYQFGVCGVGGPDGCTAFALLPSATDNRHLFLGQNWDWIPNVLGAIVHTIDDDGFETLGFTEAGIVGSKIGLNSVGLGLTINGLVSSVDDWSRWSLPFHARCFDVLRSRSLDAARAIIAEAPRACSANFLLAMPPESAVDIEAAPLSLRELHPRDSMLIHSNHFLDPARLGIEQPIVDPRPHSRWRQARMQTLLEARRPVSEGDLEAALRDHDNYPDSICRHENDVDPPEERYLTVTSVIMDLDERSMRLTDGPPCEHLYEAYSLPHTALLAASRDGQPITTGSN